MTNESMTTPNLALDQRRRKAGMAMVCAIVLLTLSLIVTSCVQIASTVLPTFDTDPIDGGNEFFSQFGNSLSDAPDFFPIAVWHESLLAPTDVELDRSFGINTYVELTPDSDPHLAKDYGSFALSSTPNEALNGFVLPDEVDMWGKSGHGNWTGAWPGEAPICDPEDSRCGYTVLEESLRKAPEKLMTYANFGKGVTFWDGDEASAHFINEYANVVSADNYWFTDPFICSKTEGGTKLPEARDLSTTECRLAANYGWTVQRLRNLVAPRFSKPVWGFVELGQPFADELAPSISPSEIHAAVWHSLIAGARGIVYFNHNFAGSCASQHVLRDCGEELSGAVADINAEIQAMAPVLNAPSVPGIVTVTGNASVLVKVQGGYFYVIAGSAQNASQTVGFQVACASSADVEVLNEGRSLKITDRSFEDEFQDGNSVHIYRLRVDRCAPAQ